VLLDAYAMALEQQILAEAFFTLALAASFFLVAGRDRGPVSLAASGALLAAAATMRTAAMFAVPVWALYVVWVHRGPRLAVPAALGLVIPLLAYASWHAADTGRFGLTQADGWFLYGRVGEIADCGDANVPAAARLLCNRNARDRREGAAYHGWQSQSDYTKQQHSGNHREKRCARGRYSVSIPDATEAGEAAQRAETGFGAGGERTHTFGLTGRQ